ncbi:AAA family ATPase [Stigmatella aurantiaca]|uniref:Exonuclease SbcC n=1 Tax=Stigmatella aurantiaca (strain DW4/3-1) TaxID=378806 RepID=Q08QT9_STIAD|nr:AAA family ATPase [Stigmatella aurantiaca]ADO74789.1 nuclease, C subunit [Stigmatella aurantiaca DW4/3-1]EAU62853.1 exonuclease SbcC [Stigmatella aurantiaca DW4/3-1]
MKILAIRGRNLTSLAGDFALALDEPPLDKLGLFAITGATGAGKSTLLDALCLALFDRTPRLGGRGGVPVGRSGEEDEDRLLSHDVRGVLRRGAAEGFAEVDFQGRDGKRYRARWSVWRARNKAEGRFRPQELSLTDVASGQLFGRTKLEVLEAIEQKLGLSFDQFRRSALLAQGEFAAFLRADANERAELLERMTGTEIYSRLSIAAHERHKTEQAGLERMSQGLAAISRLTDEERAAAEGALAVEEAARVQQERVLKDASAAMDWYAERVRRVASEREASEAWVRAEKEVGAAAPREDLLARVRAAETFRAPVVSVETAERMLAEASAAQASRAAEAAKTHEVVGARQDALRTAEQARSAALAEEATQVPALAEAARLDAQLVMERRDAHEASQRAASSRSDEARQRAVLADLSQQEEAARGAAEAARTWLSSQPRLEAIAKEWPRWEAELSRYERAAGSEREARQVATQKGSEVKGLREAADQRRREREAHGASMEKAQAAALQAEAEVGEDAGSARRALRESLLARQEVLRSLGAAQVGGVAEAAAEREALEEVEGARREAEAAQAEARDAAARRGVLEASCTEARRALTQAQLAQGYASQRAALKEGEACPLCGAKEHPYGHAGAALDGLVVEASARVETLESERARTERVEASALARAQGALSRGAQAESRKHATNLRLAGHRGAWAAARARLEAPLPPETPEEAEAAAWLEGAQKELLARLASVRAEEEAAEQRARAAKEARAALESWRAKVEAAAEALRRAEDALGEAERALQQAEREAEQAAEVRRQSLVELGPAFTGWGDWEARLAENPSGFRKRGSERVATWHAHQDALRAAQEREAEGRQARAAAEAKAETLRSVAEGHAAASQRAVEALQRTQAERGGMLNGRPTEEVRAQLRAAVDAATAAFEKARERAEAAGREDAVATARAEEAVKARASAAEAHAQALTSLEGLLRGQGLALDEVRALLARDAAWCEAEARALEGIREAHARARAVLDERRGWRARHEASAPPALPEPEVEAVLERARAQVEGHRANAARWKARLDQDHEARERHGAQERALEERRRAAGVWKTLHELIGSADGKKFKVFAQSLTLDALLLHANAHLQELARRYRLMRVPGHDLDLQVVDQDMGDEVRAVASLSGGESFLVSLALALGLASLSSETAQVETLFIDEGFGTLDPQTLEVALATLDALQATGRQVGIISHVSGLAERIGVQVRVVKQGGGRSRLVVEADLGLGALPTVKPGQRVA